MSDKKISVILPIYNVEQYLDRCINCLLNQTYKNLEIILIDDGSPDNCPQMCDEWAEKDDRIIAIHKENGGVSSARNIGIDIATGDYISFIDPDDVISKEYYEILIDGIKDAECALCGYKSFSENIEFDIKQPIEFEILSNIDAIKLGLSNKDEIFYVIWNKIIKTDIVKNFSFDITMKNGEDTYFAFDVINSCKKIAAINRDLYGYFERDDGAVKSIDVQGRKDKLKAAKHIFDICSLFDNNTKEISRKNYFWKIIDSYSKLSNKTERRVLSEERKFAISNLDVLIFDKKTSLIGKVLALLVLMK